jgi:hypothetical protein
VALALALVELSVSAGDVNSCPSMKVVGYFVLIPAGV